MKKAKVISLALVCSMLLGMIEPAGFVSSQAADLCYEKIDSALQEKMVNSEEVLSVHVWFNDYDLEELETKIEDEIGFSVNELEENFEAPSPELTAALEEAAQKYDENADENSEEALRAEQLLSSYIESTADARKREEDRTALYMNARKRICTEMHHEEAEKVANSCGISSESITYMSDFAPFMICNLTTDDIVRVSQCDEVQEIYLYQDPGVTCEEDVPARSISSIDDYIANNESVGAIKARNKFSLNTSNARIGFFAVENVANSYADLQALHQDLPLRINPNTVHVVCTHSPSCYVPSNHHSWCATIAGGYYGVAPNAAIYTASMETDSQTGAYNDYQALMNQVDVVCWEYVHYTHSTPEYTEMERTVDAMTRSTCTLNVVPAGNSGNSDAYIVEPGNAYNVITAGGYIVGNPDTMYSNSSYIQGNHCLKPDVIAPACLGGVCGTSYSAPMIAGMIALLIRYKPSLKAKPEVCKAILMASCHRKINESMSSGLTNREGAGIPNMYTMLNIVAQQTYGYGCLKSSNNYSQTKYFNQQMYGANAINMCMAFLHSGVANDNLDVDISLKKRDGTLIGNSNASYSSVEMVYSAITTGNYKLEVAKYGYNQETTPFGYAWSTNKTYNYNVDNRNNEDIICFLRNSGSGYYMTQNLSTNALTQESFTGNLNQLWLLTENHLTDDYAITNAGSKDYGLKKGANLGSGYYQAQISNLSTIPIDYLNIWDGSKQITYSNYALVTNSSSLSLGAAMAWKLADNTDSAQKWFLEVVPYHKGDANHDGTLNSSDVTKIQTMINGIQSGQTYINLEMYLADFNSDGLVNSSDKNALSTYLSNTNNN